MNTHRINKRGVPEPMMGLLYPTEATIDEVVEFIGKEDVRQLISFIDQDTWIIQTYDDSLVLLSPAQFENDGFYINIDPVIWEVYEFTYKEDPDPPQLTLMGSVDERDLLHWGFGYVYGVFTDQEWFDPTKGYIFRRNDGRLETRNPDGVFV